MSEDALVNTGAVIWPEHDWAQVTVRRMQAKLHCWAAGDPGRRFDDLYNLVCDPAFLVVAWQRVAGNVGARTAGIDRATVRLAAISPAAAEAAGEGWKSLSVADMPRDHALLELAASLCQTDRTAMESDG